jgi:hypothetical protein
VGSTRARFASYSTNSRETTRAEAYRNYKAKGRSNQADVYSGPTASRAEEDRCKKFHMEPAI